MFNIEIYKKKLRSEWLGQKIIYSHTLESTNDSIWNSEHGIESGILLVAEEQTNGRGRNGHTWFSSAKKSLTFSILIRTDSLGIEKGMIPIATGLCICENINSSISLQARIKWPNDILIKGKKVCGILCETKMHNAKEYISIGVGININQLSGDFPLSLVDDVTSLAIAGGSVINREAFLASLINKIEVTFRDKNSADLKKIWRVYCDHSNIQTSFNSYNKKISGKFLGITNSGEARITTNDGIEIISSGVIEYANPSN